jgi:hypothetical protein
MYQVRARGILANQGLRWPRWPRGFGGQGVSVAKWLAHLPFTSEAAGSNLTRYFLDATRTQSSCEKSKSQRSGFLPQGKLTGWVR